jgi:hypothetical protein
MLEDYEADWLPAHPAPVVQLIHVWLPTQAHMQASTILKARSHNSAKSNVSSYASSLPHPLCIPTPKAQSGHSRRKPIT